MEVLLINIWVKYEICWVVLIVKKDIINEFIYNYNNSKTHNREYKQLRKVVQKYDTFDTNAYCLLLNLFESNSKRFSACFRCPGVQSYRLFMQ